jgi:hypothetical protein
MIGEDCRVANAPRKDNYTIMRDHARGLYCAQPDNCES